MKLLTPMLGFVAIVLAFEIILFQLLAHGILNTFIAIIIQIIGVVAVFTLLLRFILSMISPFIAALRGDKSTSEDSEKEKQRYHKFAERDDELGEIGRASCRERV